MTSTLTPPGATEGRPRSQLVVADLLPREIVQARLARKIRRAVLSGLAAVTVLLVAWCAVAVVQTHRAQDDLAAARDQAAALRAKQSQYAEVVTVQAQSAAIDAQLESLMARDLQWTTVLATVRQLQPQGVALTAVTGTLPTGLDTAGDTSIVKLPNTTGEQTIGTLTVSGTGASKALIASYVDALAKVSGLGNPVVSGVTFAEGTLQFTAQLDITESMLGGRYTASGGEH
jgi:type IV pilus assembly protein PilN